MNTLVYFDDFTVAHKRSPILEDNAYYPYGLKIDGIIAKAALKPLNKYNYQGDYAEQDEETGYNEFELRNFDPQTGRWIQVDPYDEFASGYVGMGNNPVNNVDPDGGEVNDWGRFRNSEGHVVPRFDEMIKDQASAEAYAARHGLTNTEYLFKSGSWTSNMNGMQDWNLFDDGTFSKAAFPRFTPDIDVSRRPITTVSEYVPHPNAAGKWDDFNQHPMAKTTDFGGLSNAIYGMADGIWTFSSMVKNGWRGARNMRGDNLISTYGGQGAANYRYGATVSVLTLPLMGIEGGSVSETNLYRFDTRSPFEINNAGGFKSWGNNMNLLEHVEGTSIANRTSGYIGTSLTEKSAISLSKGNPGYIYKIQFTKGVNVNLELGSKSLYKFEQEVAIPKTISKDLIKNYWPVNMY